MFEDLIPVVLFLSIAATLIVLFYLRYRAHREKQLTMRLAIEKGQDLTPEFLQQLSEALTPKNADLRRGAIAIATGLGFVAFGLLVGEEDAVGPLLAISAFPFLIGVAYVALWKFNGQGQ